MKRVLLLVLFAITVSWSTAFAGDMGTPDEAKALAEKAAAFLKSNGPDKAFPAFQAKDGGFHSTYYENLARKHHDLSR